ncbi:unnamed protein product (macronuclear) [Paramecium tetraurelia]|uniref:MORN repeat protein n=1 Tax=Paramecium tetraurelia TaxID=5888 RepID=A0E3V9_PARTE|nr:uncharacterized protein GSPATT00023149001 [Paramecium tetraurelia]CAK89976.1 unnamed protein product [Paramecium tetraurelia]|eukprot:XP_001457373.1 hypothetical protein (macronuclear) [Paramecium tetraurelia strain d4-2]
MNNKNLTDLDLKKVHLIMSKIEFIFIELKHILWMIKFKEKEFLILRKEINIKENFMKIRSMAMESFIQKKEIGEYWKDKRQGRGTYFFPIGDMQIYILFNFNYNGQFQDDQMHGKGELKIQNTGDIYTGSFKNNKKEGDFEIKHSNGQIAKVTFKNDQLIGNVKSIIQKAIKGSIFHDRKQ